MLQVYLIIVFHFIKFWLIVLPRLFNLLKVWHTKDKNDRRCHRDKSNNKSIRAKVSSKKSSLSEDSLTIFKQFTQASYQHDLKQTSFKSSNHTFRSSWPIYCTVLLISWLPQENILKLNKFTHISPIPIYMYV